MNTKQECGPCLLRQAQEATALAATSAESGREVLRQVYQLVGQADWNLPTPVLGQTMHRLIRQLTHNPDPYASIKQRLNRRAAEMYPTWQRRFRNSFPPLEAAVRLAIVGNLLDVGAKTQLDEANVETVFADALTAPLRGSVQELAGAIRAARSILYLADNAGEIVFDRDLLAQLPLGNFTLAVRGHPVLNDATLADAELAGLAGYCKLIANGSDAPGTIVGDCSPEFRQHFNAADLVIAKGQGNYETLVGSNKHIFFLLKIKCDVLSQHLGWPRGSLVLYRQRPAALIRGAASPASTHRITAPAEP